jgi:hypothetical protein
MLHLWADMREILLKHINIRELLSTDAAREVTQLQLVVRGE